MREWAAANGHDVKLRGRVPEHIIGGSRDGQLHTTAPITDGALTLTLTITTEPHRTIEPWIRGGPMPAGLGDQAVELWQLTGEHPVTFIALTTRL